MKKYKFKHRFETDIDLGADFYIEMRGQKSLALYGCRGIAEYSPKCIKLYLYKHILTVEGDALLCDSYTNGAVLISGRIIGIYISEVS